MRLGSSEGRMSESSDEIGLASFSSGCPPPNRRACGSARKAQVMASLKPREASERRAASMRFCSGFSTGLAMALVRSIGWAGMLSRPQMRVTSSTRSASP